MSVWLGIMPLKTSSGALTMEVGIIYTKQAFKPFRTYAACIVRNVYILPRYLSKSTLAEHYALTQLLVGVLRPSRLDLGVGCWMLDVHYYHCFLKVLEAKCTVRSEVRAYLA